MTLPESLSDIATDDGTVLRVQHSKQTWALDSLNQATTWLLAFTVLLGIATFGFGFLCMAVWLPMIGLLWAGAAYTSRRSRWMSFSTQGIHISGPKAPAVPYPHGIMVRGAPGGPCELWADETRLLHVELKEQGPWTPHALTAIAGAAADRLGVPLDDQRPLAAWDRWCQDPVYRAAARWDRRRRANVREYPEHCTVAPGRASTAVQDHHGMTVTLRQPGLVDSGIALTLTLDHLVHGDLRIPLASIVRVGPHFHTVGPHYRASFQVLTRGDWLEIIDISVASNPGPTTRILRWLTQEIEDRAEDARKRTPQDRGEAADIPESLRAMRATERHPI